MSTIEGDGSLLAALQKRNKLYDIFPCLIIKKFINDRPPHEFRANLYDTHKCDSGKYEMDEYEYESVEDDRKLHIGVLRQRAPQLDPDFTRFGGKLAEDVRTRDSVQRTKGLFRFPEFGLCQGGQLGMLATYQEEAFGADEELAQKGYSSIMSFCEMAIRASISACHEQHHAYNMANSPNHLRWSVHMFKTRVEGLMVPDSSKDGDYSFPQVKPKTVHQVGNEDGIVKYASVCVENGTTYVVLTPGNGEELEIKGYGNLVLNFAIFGTGIVLTRSSVPDLVDYIYTGTRTAVSHFFTAAMGSRYLEVLNELVSQSNPAFETGIYKTTLLIALKTVYTYCYLPPVEKGLKNDNFQAQMLRASSVAKEYMRRKKADERPGQNSFSQKRPSWQKTEIEFDPKGVFGKLTYSDEPNWLETPKREDLDD